MAHSDTGSQSGGCLQPKRGEASSPLFLLALPLLQLLQVFLGQLDDVAGLLLRGRAEGGGATVEGLTGGGAGEALPQVLVDRLALQKFGPMRWEIKEIQDQSETRSRNL